MNLIKRAGVYRELAILTAMLILTALLSFPARAEEAESQHEHVRVGFFAMDGYHMMDEDGNRSGYGYDFLRLIARYWDADYSTSAMTKAGRICSGCCWTARSTWSLLPAKRLTAKNCLIFPVPSEPATVS